MADNDQRLHDADRLDIPGPRKVKRTRVQLDSEKFGQFAEATARFMGTAKFLVYMTVIVCTWVVWNLVAIYKLRFDPYPFILLNLFFSTQASYSAPLILLAQNRQEDRDRVSMAEDRRVAAQSRADLGLADIRNSEGLPETPVSAPSSVVHDEAVPVPFDLEAT